MQFVTDIPLHACRLKPELMLKMMSFGDLVLLGGLIREEAAECRQLEREFWTSFSGNGRLVRPDAPPNALSLRVSMRETWVPDDEAMENIDAQALSDMGVGLVRWYGSAPYTLYAGYSLTKGEQNVKGPQSWSFREALEAMMSDAGVSRLDPEFRKAQQAAAMRYGQSVISELKKIRKGDVYGVVVYAISLKKGQALEEFSSECWGHIGKEYAESALVDAMGEVSRSLELAGLIHLN